MLTSEQMRVFPNRASMLHCGDTIKRRKTICLFGVPDPVQTEKLYQDQMMTNRVNFLQKYNFDICSGLPASRRPDGLRWEEASPLRGDVDDVEEGGVNVGGNCNNSSLEETTMHVSECTNEEVHRKNKEMSRDRVRTGRVERCSRSSQRSKQLKLTDFWPKKKRNHP